MHGLCRAVAAAWGRLRLLRWARVTDGKQHLLTRDAAVIPYGLDLYAVPFESKVRRACVFESKVRRACVRLQPRAEQPMRQEEMTNRRSTAPIAWFVVATQDPCAAPRLPLPFVSRVCLWRVPLACAPGV